MPSKVTRSDTLERVTGPILPLAAFDFSHGVSWCKEDMANQPQEIKLHWVLNGTNTSFSGVRASTNMFLTVANSKAVGYFFRRDAVLAVSPLISRMRRFSESQTSLHAFQCP